MSREKKKKTILINKVEISPNRFTSYIKLI